MKATTQIPRVGVMSPFGTPVTRETMPPDASGRWTMRKKAEVLTAVSEGLLSLDEACDQYNLSPAELASWKTAIGRAGVEGLMAKNLCRPSSESR